MSTNATAARVSNGNSAHWYRPTGEPMHWIERSDGKGTRPTTLRDARKLGLLPSPTSILKVLDKPQLTSWLIEQSCLAVLTAPRRAGEELDAFVERVLHTERQQDEQAQKARQLGTDIHDGVEQVLNGYPCMLNVTDYVMPAVEAMKQFGVLVGSEEVVVGDGYAGRLDAWFQDSTRKQTVVDVKTTGAVTLPTEAYWEHRVQCAAYAKALPLAVTDQTTVVYVSTRIPGEVSLCVQTDWSREWRAFELLLQYWQTANNYNPKNQP